MMNKIKILEWNANGIENRKDEMQVTLDINQIDICLISETHFKLTTDFKLQGYNLYHSPHPHNCAVGGAAVLIKNTIEHHIEAKFQSCAIQGISISIKTISGQISVASVYCSPSYRLKKNDFKSLFRIFHNRLIAGGDFNAKNKYWGSRLTNTRGRELYETIKEDGAKYHSTGKPTYWPTDRNKTPDLVDFFISKNISSNKINVEEGPDLQSDHSSILLTLGDKIIIKEYSPKLVNRLTDWNYFRQKLEESIQLSSTIQTEDQLEEAVQIFTLNIQKAAWAATPKTTKKIKQNSYPREICEIITEKRKARKRWQQTRAPSDKTTLNNLNNKLRKSVREFNNESLKTYLTSLTNDASTEYSLWKATKKMNRPIAHIPPVKTREGNWAKSSREKANTFAEYLEDVFKPYEDKDYQGIEARCEEDRPIRPVTAKELAKEIKEGINIKKAPGFDLITGEILKQFPRKGLKKTSADYKCCIQVKICAKHVEGRGGNNDTKTRQTT